MRFGERRALRPLDELVERPPPGFHLVVTRADRPPRPFSGLMVQLHRARSVHLVSNEAFGLIHQMDPLSETVLEVDFVALGDGNAIRDANHRAIIARFEPRAVRDAGLC